MNDQTDDMGNLRLAIERAENCMRGAAEVILAMDEPSHAMCFIAEGLLNGADELSRQGKDDG